MGDGEEVGDVRHVGGEQGTELCELTPWGSPVGTLGLGCGGFQSFFLLLCP